MDQNILSKIINKKLLISIDQNTLPAIVDKGLLISSDRKLLVLTNKKPLI